MAMIKKGTQVKIKKTLLTGTVVGYSLSTDQTELTCLVAYTDDDGVQHQRTFAEEQLEVIVAQEA